MVNGFKEEEINKFVEFLNYIATNARFDNLTVKDQIEFVNLLSYQQQVLLGKMQSLVAEDPKVHTPAAEPAAEEKKPVKKKTTRKTKASS